MRVKALGGNGHAAALNKSSMRAVVTGGGGYFGYKLGCALASKGASVVLYDMHKPIWEIPSGVVCIQADLRNYHAILAACEGADCVFHVASYGMSGKEQWQKEQIESININGTRYIIEACQHHSISRLIYTSTVNVVFGGLPIEDGDEESVPYFPLDKYFMVFQEDEEKILNHIFNNISNIFSGAVPLESEQDTSEHVDHYSRTKSIAEQMVLAADGTLLAGGGVLHTCVIRPPGIYGPDEQRHLPRLAKLIERGLLSFKFGDPSAKVNWVHVENLAQAQILAAEALTAKRNYIASGQVYFINDGEKYNIFEWLTPLFERLGRCKPWIRIPTWVVYASAMAMEYLYLMLKPIVELSPVLTRNEVLNISVTHTFRIDKARAQLGYRPKKFVFADSVDHYIKSRPKGRNHHILLQVLIVFIVTLGFICVSLGFYGLSVLRSLREQRH